MSVRPLDKSGEVKSAAIISKRDIIWLKSNSWGSYKYIIYGPIESILFNKSLLYKLNGPVMAYCYGYTVFDFHFNVYQAMEACYISEQQTEGVFFGLQSVSWSG